MTRTVPEWIGKNDDEPVPPRVMLRLFDKSGGRCCYCGRVIGGNLRPRFDHITAITNGGPNRESNLQLLCHVCHDLKTKVDVRVKSKLARTRLKHLGIKRRKGRPMPGGKESLWKKTFRRGWVRR